MQERTRDLGSGAATPERTFDDPGRYRDVASKRLETKNPSAADIRYTPENEARDLSAKLAEYSAATTSPDPAARHVDLTEALRISQRSAREVLAAEEDYILAALRLLIERHGWGPIPSNETSATISGQGDDGDFQSAVNVINDLRVSQRLPYGGAVSARWLWDMTEQLRETATGRYRQSSQIVLDASVPLLRGAGLVAQEGLIQAERDLVYQARDFEQFRRRFLTEIARDYFGLLQFLAQIDNQVEQLKSVQQTERVQRAMYEAGRIAEFEVNNASNDVLRSQADLAGLRERYILQLDQFKIRLGLAPSTPVVIDPLVLNIPEPDVTLEAATAAALDYRLDLQTRRDRVEDAERGVNNARNDLLPDLNLTGSVGVPTDPDKRSGGLTPSPGDLNYSAGVTFGLPLDREAERLRLRQATIGLLRTRRDYEQFRDQVVIDVRQAVRNIDLSRFQLDLAERQVQINQRRVDELQIKVDQVDTQRQLDAKNSLLQSQNARDQARTDLRNAILDYLLQSGQLRVARDGTFQPLAGMPATTGP